MKPAVPTPEEFLAVSESEQFRELRGTFRKFAFPLSFAFLAWFLFYIVTATYAHDFVSTKLYGAINVGMVLGLAQFATTALVTWIYVHFADNTLDPATAALRDSMTDSSHESAVV